MPDPPKALYIQSQARPGETLVTISLTDGSVTFGPNFTQDEASRVFWLAVEAYGRDQMARRGMVQ
jgi:hypothetical protein